jgi:PAS domain S-box-containing protein
VPHQQPRRQRPAGAALATGELLYERIARLAAGDWNRNGQLGLVVGATYPREIARVRELAPTLPLLIPGIGAQGGDAAATVRAGWRGRADGQTTGPILVSSSRAVLYAGADDDFALLVAFALVTLCGAVATRVPPRWVEPALAVVVAMTVVALALASLLVGWGLGGPGLAWYGLLACIICALARRTLSLLVVAVMALCLVGVHVAPQLLAGLGNPLQPHATPPTRLLVHLLVLAGGLAAGVLISQVVARYMRAAQDREQRFRRLLALAADAYWEIDPEHRLVAATGHHGEANVLTPATGLGAVPWDLPSFGCDAETLDQLQADLGSREPFRDLPVRWVQGDGSARSYLVSGEPRYDDRGVFQGYWGVARDITADAARAALAGHRDALPGTVHAHSHAAGAAPRRPRARRQPRGGGLFGHDRPGRWSAATCWPATKAATRASALAAASNNWRTSRWARRCRSQTTGMHRARAPHCGARHRRARRRRRRPGAAVDLRRRHRAPGRRGQAVRRSEAMLSHLVATSPDLITLTDLATGRYAMVNHTFERVIGWTAAEAVGRTSAELGVWASSEDRERFIAPCASRARCRPAHALRHQGRATISMLVSAARFVMDRRDYLVINARDVTDSERDRLEREAILANASIGIAVTRDATSCWPTRHFEQMYGWEPGADRASPADVCGW